MDAIALAPWRASWPSVPATVAGPNPVSKEHDLSLFDDSGSMPASVAAPGNAGRRDAFFAAAPATLRDEPFAATVGSVHEANPGLLVDGAAALTVTQGDCAEAASGALMWLGAVWLAFFKIPTVLGAAAVARWFWKDAPPIEDRVRRTVERLPVYAFTGGRVEELKKRYAALYAEKIEKGADGWTRFGKARRRERDGISVLHLKGDPFEMAFQHGALMREEIADGVVPLIARKIPNTIRGVLGDRSRFYGSVAWFLNRFVHARLLAHMPAAYREELLALSEGSGAPLYQVLAAMTSYETVHILAKYAIGDAKVQAKEAANSCSSFAVWDAKAGGSSVIGRNFDNALNGHFDAHPTVIYFEPEDGSQKYVSITSAGVHTGGITAWNESGIFVAVHTVPTRETAANATMTLPVLTEAMRRAKSFDEALKIIGSSRSSVGWAILLASTKEKRFATVELTSEKMAVRESRGGTHVQTNHFLLPEMLRRLMYVNASADEDSRARFKRLNDLIAGKEDPFTKKDAMRALADQVDPWHGVERGNENTVGVHTNVSSAVVLPEENRFFVANGLAPVAHNRYVEFPSPGAFDPETFAQAPYETVDNGAWKDAHPEMFAAVKAFIEAKKAYEYRKDIKESLRLLKEVARLDPGNTAYLFNLGIMAAKAGETGTALAVFSDILRVGYPAQNVALARYYRGRMLAVARDTAALAEESLREVADDASACPKLRAAARTALAGLKRNGTHAFDPMKVALMMQQADAENY